MPTCRSGRTACGFVPSLAAGAVSSPLSVAVGEAAGAAVIDEATRERAGVADGVGSTVTQPYWSNHTSTQAWASVSRTIQAFLLSE